MFKKILRIVTYKWGWGGDGIISHGDGVGIGSGCMGMWWGWGQCHGDGVGWGCKFIPVSVFRADCMRMSLNVIINLVQLFFFYFSVIIV